MLTSQRDASLASTTTSDSLATCRKISLSVETFLDIAIGVCQALHNLHSRRQLHKALRPELIVFDRQSGSASLLEKPEEHGEVLTPGNASPPPIAYLSPEQHGRLNVVVDSRSDLYSLGVVFYELLTGDLPFRAEDQLEWVHCHIARVPKAPIQLRPQLPLILSDIIMKLLAKSMEERYQSAIGLQNDFERCRRSMKSNREIAPFILGLTDTPQQLLVPERLYGRADDIERLHQAFSRVRTQNLAEMILVSGYAGIGKTSLVRQLYRQVIQANAFFVLSKFDQFRRNIPYETFVEAFRGLIRQLLTEQEGNLAPLKREIELAIGGNGQLIVDLIPQLELIIGPQTPVADLPPAEAENRLRTSLLQFISVFCQNQRPLVMFLDDLQWADTASLKLIEHLVADPDVGPLLFIGAYRDSELGPTHPLTLSLETIQASAALLHHIHLAPLSEKDLGDLLADTLHTRGNQLQGLTDLLHQKTGGNPFFVLQFLQMLADEHMLRFDQKQRIWKWKIEEIRQKGFTDNVIDLMTEKLKRLQPGTREAIRLAACIGNRFRLDSLAQIAGFTPGQVREQLAPAVDLNLIITTEGGNCRFVHDRIQQAAYGLTAQADRAAVHLQIGRLMLGSTPAAELADRTFEIANQFLRGGHLAEERKEKHRIAELTLMAGVKARASCGFRTALEYLQMAAGLLDEESWHQDYQLSFEVFKLLAEVHYLNSNHAESHRLLHLLLGKSTDPLTQAELYNMLIIQHTLVAEYQQALEYGRRALLLLDLELPTDRPEEELKKQLANFNTILGDRVIATLADDREMADARMRACSELLANILVPARYTSNALFALIATISVNQSIELGPTAKSTVGYTAFAMVLQNAMGRYQDAYEFGELALKISERFNNPAQKCQACMVLGHYLTHWVRHLKEADQIMEEGLSAGMSVGEMQWTGYILSYKLFQPYARGELLATIDKELPALQAFTRKTRNQWATDNLSGLQLALGFLRTDCSVATNKEWQRLKEQEESFLIHCAEQKSFGALGRYRVIQAQMHLLFDNIKEGLQAVDEAKALIGFFSSSISTVELNFYHSLLLARAASSASGDERLQLLAAIADNQRALASWTKSCPANFCHRHKLVAAEIARLEARVLDAGELYEQALQAAKESGFGHDEALIAELAGRLYHDRNQPTISSAYFNRARNCYLLWGAEGKVRQLDRLYPDLLMAGKSKEQDRERATVNLDLLAVAKASQAISSEIVLSSLLKTLMQTVLQNSGAERASLLLLKQGQLLLRASARVRGQKIEVGQHDQPPTAEELPLTIITYVHRTGELVLLDNAPKESLFSSDPYFQGNQPLSLLCLPLTRRSLLTGMLYLENNLIRSAFTRERLSILELLASQAAISLENAALYLERSQAEADLRESEEKYRAVFEDTGTPLAFINEDKSIDICNNAFEQLSGFSRDELEGMTWTNLVASREDLERMVVYHQLRRLEPGAAPQNYEFQFRTKDGMSRDVVATVNMMRGTQKSLAALLDITERKRAVRALHQSEQKFKAIFDRSVQFMGLLSTDGLILDVNETALLFAGAKRHEVLGKPFWQAPWIANSPTINLAEDIQRAISQAAAGHLVKLEIIHTAHDGSQRYFDFSLKPVTDEQGQVTLLIPEGRDITDRKMAEAEQARLATAIEQSAEAIFITDTDFIIRYANPAIERLCGFSQTELLSQFMGVLASPSQSSKRYSEMLESLKSGEVWSGRLTHQRKNQSQYEAEVTASPVRDRDDKIINYVLIHRDISREVQLEKEVRQAHKMEAIGTLAGGIAHDFNNILTVIQGHAQLTHLKMSAGDPLRDRLEQILVSCSRARDMVRQILAFSRKTDHAKKPVNIAKLLGEVMQLLRSSIPTTIEMKLDITLDPSRTTILADETQIHQVLMNLATNAAHAMRAKGGQLGVRLSIRELLEPVEQGPFSLAAGNYFELRISDTGIGIEEQFIDRIFDPYFTTKGPGEGSGMGLAVSLGIIKSHRGAIQVESTPGRGTAFTVLLPESRTGFIADAANAQDVPTGHEHILLVDDESEVVSLASEMLELLGYRVTCANSSQEALELFADSPSRYDLVLTDMTMPKMTGTELADRLLAIRPAVPIILCTGYSDQLYQIAQNSDKKIKAVLMKPFDIQELATALRKVLD